MSVYNPAIPYCDRIHHPLVAGTIIRVNGSPHPSSRCFAVNLQCGPSVNPRDDIALHLSPVFTPPPRVVRNSLQAQRWGPEESFGGFPFIAGQPFEVLILIDSDHFKIAVNGSHFTEFRYRIPLNRISYMQIDGEVSISSITYEGSQPSYGAPTAPPPMVSAPGFPSYPPSGAPGQLPYPPSGAPYQPSAGPYVPPPAYATGAPMYPSAQVPGPTYPTGGYPQASYPAAGYPTTAYPHSPKSQNKGILGGALGGTLGGLAAGAAASSIGSAILGKGHHKGHHGYPGYPGYPGSHTKHSSPIPIAGLAAGAGAAALGAAVLTGHHPFKKAKKMFKHKGHKPKFGKWKHKGWSSGSSSSEEE